MRRHARRAVLAVLAAALALAGCGGHRQAQARPTLPHAVALQLAAASDEVARELDAGNGCGALSAAHRLEQQASTAIAGGRVPAALRRTLRFTVADVTSRIRCVVPVATTTTSTPPPKEKHGHKHDHHGKHKGDGGGEGD